MVISSVGAQVSDIAHLPKEYINRDCPPDPIYHLGEAVPSNERLSDSQEP
jgi:hypothetical protein